jgi:hypothetical protein
MLSTAVVPAATADAVLAAAAAVRAPASAAVVPALYSKLWPVAVVF